MLDPAFLETSWVAVLAASSAAALIGSSTSRCMSLRAWVGMLQSSTPWVAQSVERRFSNALMRFEDSAEGSVVVARDGMLAGRVSWIY
ncbi:hypothetical protein C8R45DRAFT_996601 [Mycena sanguinolenta]|nr:hypothetical protein C8R45DRAFT_996601 [Mycena sanguinolenta]